MSELGGVTPQHAAFAAAAWRADELTSSTAHHPAPRFVHVRTPRSFPRGNRARALETVGIIEEPFFDDQSHLSRVAAAAGSSHALAVLLRRLKAECQAFNLASACKRDTALDLLTISRVQAVSNPPGDAIPTGRSRTGTTSRRIWSMRRRRTPPNSRGDPQHLTILSRSARVLNASFSVNLPSTLLVEIFDTLTQLLTDRPCRTE